MGVCFQLYCSVFFISFPYSQSFESHTSHCNSYLPQHARKLLKASSWTFPWQYAETGDISGHYQLTVQVQFSKWTFYFSVLL